jgi:hypothetical protein
MTLARLHGRTHQFVEEKVAAISRGLGPAHVLWLCAVVPLVMLPPLVALIAAVTAMRRTSDQPPAVNFEWIAIVSAVNLIVSGLVLYKFHVSPTEVFGFAGAAARAVLRFLFGIFPGIPSTPRATPV